MTFNIKDLAREGHTSTASLGRVFYYIALAVTVASLMSLAIVPQVLRGGVPAEVDDSYAYIAKAAQMEECFFQGCPAIADLKEQWAGAAEFADLSTYKDFRLIRSAQRMIVVYHPLHSFLIMSLERAGLSPESAYLVVAGVGALLLALAIGALLKVLWGPGPAAIGLFGLAFMRLQGHGFTFIVPGNLSLMVALFFWVLIIIRCGAGYGGGGSKGGESHKGELSYRCGPIFFLLPPLMIGLHPIGLLYSAMGGLIYLIYSREDIFLTRLIRSATPLLWVLLYFILKGTVRSPLLGVESGPTFGGLEHLASSIDFAFNVLVSTLYHFGPPEIFIVIIPLFIAITTAEKGYGNLLLLLLFASVIGATLFHHGPGLEGNLLVRLWPLGAIMVAGIFGKVLWTLISIFASSAVTLREAFRLRAGGYGPSIFGSGLSFTLAFIAVILLGVPYGTTVGSGPLRVKQVIGEVASHQPVRFEREGVDLLRGDGCGVVLYFDLMVMPYYLTHGALQCGALYGPLVTLKGEGERWYSKGSGITHVAPFNPLGFDYRGLRVDGDRGLAIDFDTLKEGDTIFLKLAGGGGRVKEAITFVFTGGSTGKGGEASRVASRLTLGEGARWGWIKVDSPIGGSGVRLSIASSARSDGVYLKGIDLGGIDPGGIDPEGGGPGRAATSKLNWPWNKGVSIIKVSDGETIDLSTEGLVPITLGRGRVISDRGSSLLIKVGEEGA